MKGSAENVLIRYYAGEVPDDQNRYLNRVQRWPDDLLESVHDYIQWMFPLREPSPFNPSAPLLDDDSILAFRTRPKLQENLRISFRRMLKFYGLEMPAGSSIVKPALAFAEQSQNWLNVGNHNHLRLTRIIKSLSTLGLRPESQGLCECLVGIHQNHRNQISQRTLRFWKEAAEE
jgi:Opioid growth factor receptor (OGFr) conserved region